MCKGAANLDNEHPCKMAICVYACSGADFSSIAGLPVCCQPVLQLSMALICFRLLDYPDVILVSLRRRAHRPAGDARVAGFLADFDSLPCQVSMIYAQHCTNAWDPDQNRHRMCFSDEHYMSALLAFKGVERETDCAGVITWADWAHGEIIHPKTYRPPELSPQLLNDLRCETHALH